MEHGVTTLFLQYIKNLAIEATKNKKYIIIARGDIANINLKHICYIIKYIILSIFKE